MQMEKKTLLFINPSDYIVLGSKREKRYAVRCYRVNVQI